MGNTGGRGMGYALIGFATVVILATGAAMAEESHPGLNAEVIYSEAVIAISRKQTDAALERLGELLKEYPNHIEGLELQALTLKNAGKEPDAIDTYKRLIKLRPETDQGPYHFELGVLYQRQKKDALAKYHLLMALKLKTNVTVTRFLVGMLAFNQADYPHARHYFQEVVADDKGELRLISHYYLGLLELKSGFPLGATRNLQVARDIAATMPDNKSAQDIKTSAEQVLEPFSTPQWFANISMLGGYDSNVGTVSTSLANSSNSGIGTGKMNLSAGAGRMTAPLDTLQFVGNYRLNLNKNTNTTTRNYEFVTNSVQLFLNYLPLSPTQGGFKVEGNFMFQNQPQDGGSATDASTRFSYGKYDMSAEIGPYFRYQPTRQIQTELDIYLRPQKFYTDDGLSGNTIFTRLSGHADVYSRYFNPGASISYENNHASSDQDAESTVGLELSNTIKFTPVDQLTAYFDLLSVAYSRSQPYHADKNYLIRVNGVHTLNSRWSVLLDIGYTKNNSTIPDSYTYNRFQNSLGISYSM